MKHYEELKALRQRPNQSIGDFLTLFESIELQLQNGMPDWVGKLFILTSAHPYLKDTLRLNGHLGETRATQNAISSFAALEKLLVRL